MHEFRKNTKKEDLRTTFEKIEKMHPHKMLMYLVMLGSSLIFLFLIFTYSSSIYFNSGFDDEFPKVFTISTVILLLSSYAISKVNIDFENDNFKRIRTSLYATLILSVLFLVCQYLGYYELNKNGYYFVGRTSGSYLYIISGLHVVHFLGGLGFLSYLLFLANKSANDPVKALITSTNPYRKLQFEMFTSYWHFLGIIWMVVFFYFLFTF